MAPSVVFLRPLAARLATSFKGQAEYSTKSRAWLVAVAAASANSLVEVVSASFWEVAVVVPWALSRISLEEEEELAALLAGLVACLVAAEAEELEASLAGSEVCWAEEELEALQAGSVASLVAAEAEELEALLASLAASLVAAVAVVASVSKLTSNHSIQTRFL